MENRAYLKKRWVEGKSNPHLFLKTFTRDKKNRLIDLHAVPSQRAIFEKYLTGKYDELYMGGGNSGGKTFALAMMGTWAASWKVYPKQEKPFSSKKEFLTAPYGILCTAAEQKHSNELWEEIVGMYKRSPYLKHLIANVAQSSRLHPHPKMTLKNGVFIDSIGLHDKGKHVVTGDYSLILVNEIGEVKHLRYILDNVLTQRTWRRGGVIVGCGTPRGGEQSEYWDVFRRGAEDEDARFRDPRVYSLYADARDNPFAEQERIEEFVSTRNEKLIEERVRGRFVGVEGAAFPIHLLDDVFDKKMPFEQPKNPRKSDIIHGLDFGRKADFTVCITLDVSKKPWKGIHFYRQGGGYGTWEQILNDISNIYHKYGGEFVADTTSMGGDVVQSWMTDMDLPFLPMNFSMSPSKKVNLINFLQRTIGEKGIILPDKWTDVKEELRNYPANLDDKTIKTDCVIALGLAAWGGEYFGSLEAPVDIEM